MGCHSGLIESEQDGFRLDSADAEAHEMRQALGAVAECYDPFNLERGGQQPFGLGTRPVRLKVEPPRSQDLGRRAEANLGGDIFHPAAASALLLAPDKKGRQPEAAPDQQRPGALGTAEFVGRHRHEIGAQIIEIDGNVTGGRDCVHVDQYAPLPAGGDGIGHRLNGRDLVIAPLAVDEGGVRVDLVDQLLHVDVALAVHPYRRHPA
jgi:hypothetical protein